LEEVKSCLLVFLVVHFIMFVDILILLLMHSPLSVLRLNSQGTLTSGRILYLSPGRMQSAVSGIEGRGTTPGAVQCTAME
jgi:hypothetical protein